MKKIISNNIKDYPDADLLFPSRYVKAADVALVGRPFPLTIRRIEPRHELQKKGSAKEYKPALFFAETERGIVLNKTNSKRLVEALGKDPRKWIGCRIVPRVEVVDSFGKEVEAIRIDIEATIAANRAKTAPASRARMPDEIEAARPETPPDPYPDEVPEMPEDELARAAAEAEAES